MRTSITAQGRTVVPAKIRKDHQIHALMQLEWIDDGETIRVIPIPADPIRAAKGSSKGLHKRLLRERRGTAACLTSIEPPQQDVE